MLVACSGIIVGGEYSCSCLGSRSWLDVSPSVLLLNNCETEEEEEMVLLAFVLWWTEKALVCFIAPDQMADIKARRMNRR